MPIVKNTQAVLRLGCQMPSDRTVIFIDNETNMSTYAFFPGVWDKPESKSAVQEMFSDTMRKLMISDRETWTEQSLPIVNHIGRWKVSIVTKTTNGSILIRSGEPKPVDAYIGIEH